jgi:hypothetical protein
MLIYEKRRKEQMKILIPSGLIKLPEGSEIVSNSALASENA